MASPLFLAAALLSCTVVDGDTLRCGDERVRLIGIDAPEMPGHCRPGRACVDGDPVASADNLRSVIAGRGVRLERHGVDRYGRTLAFAFTGGINLSCAQIEGGYAVYVANWDFEGKAGSCH